MSIITDGIISILERGWHTRIDALPMISWRPRKRNILADALANMSMDHGRSFRYSVDDLLEQTQLSPGCMLQWHTDGGMREGGLAAKACALTSTRALPNGTVSRKLLFAAVEPMHSYSAPQTERDAIIMAFEFMTGFAQIDQKHGKARLCPFS